MGSNLSKTGGGNGNGKSGRKTIPARAIAYGRLRLDSLEDRKIARSLRKNQSVHNFPEELVSYSGSRTTSTTTATHITHKSSSLPNIRHTEENVVVTTTAAGGSSSSSSSKQQQHEKQPQQWFPTAPSVESSPLLGSSVGQQPPQQQLQQEISLLEAKAIYGERIPPAWWLIPALVCATCYALYNIFIKLGSASIHPILGGVILQFVAAILGSVMLSWIVWRDGYEDLHYDAEGITWAVCAGIAVGAAEILSFTVSGLGVPATQTIPIIIGGSVGIGCILGLVLLQEMLGVQGWLGVALIIFGVGLVGTDPSGAGTMGH